MGEKDRNWDESECEEEEFGMGLDFLMDKVEFRGSGLQPWDSGRSGRRGPENGMRDALLRWVFDTFYGERRGDGSDQYFRGFSTFESC